MSLLWISSRKYNKAIKREKDQTLQMSPKKNRHQTVDPKGGESSPKRALQELKVCGHSPLFLLFLLFLLFAKLFSDGMSPLLLEED